MNCTPFVAVKCKHSSISRRSGGLGGIKKNIYHSVCKRSGISYLIMNTNGVGEHFGKSIWRKFLF